MRGAASWMEYPTLTQPQPADAGRHCRRAHAQAGTALAWTLPSVQPSSARCLWILHAHVYV